MDKGKRTKRRIRRRGIVLKLFLFVLILILLYLFVFKTNFFNIKEIKVVGANKMSSEEVIKASSCSKGENIFRINSNVCEESLNALPYIKSSKIKRNFPDKITIEIQERKEVAIMPYIGSFVYIDDEGYILSIEEKEEEEEKIELPQIVGVELSDIEVGNNVFEILDIHSMMEFIRLGERSSLFSSMKYIDCNDENNIIIELKNGIKVAFGSLHNVKYKYSFLHHILEDIEREDRDVKQILFNKGDNPVIITGGQ